MIKSSRKNHQKFWSKIVIKNFHQKLSSKNVIKNCHQKLSSTNCHQQIVIKNSDMIFVKKFTRPAFLGPKFYTKSAYIATMPNLRRISVNASKYHFCWLLLQSSTSRGHVKSINRHFHPIHCCMGKYLHNIYPYP